MDAKRAKILHTYCNFLEVHNEMLTTMINVAMTGPFANVNEVFEKDDLYGFDKEMFRNTEDPCLDFLLECHDTLEDKMDNYANINAITEEELDAFQDKDK